MSNRTDDGITYMDADFYNAIYEGNIGILKEKYSDSHFQLQRTPQNNNILHLAAQFGQLECVSWILDLPSSSSLLLEPNLKGEIPLHLAAREGHLEVVKALIAAAKALHHGMESGFGADKDMLRKTTKEGDTALHEAVMYHHSEVVKILIEEDPELLNGANNKACTPLYMAAERGYVDLVKIIIDEKATTSPAHTGIMGRTALHAAVIREDQDMTATLLKWKPDLSKQVDGEGWSPLHFAAYLGYASMVKELLENSSDKSATYLGIKDSKKTALHIAAIRGKRNIVKLLLSYCPDCCEQVDANGNNVLHFATMSSLEFFTTKMLVEENRLLRVRGVVNEKDAKGNTLLHLLASRKDYDEYFFEKSIVDKAALNDNNLNPIDILSKSKMTKSREHAHKLKERKKFVGVLSRLDAMEIDEKGKGISEERKAGGNEDSKAEEEKKISQDRREGETHLIVAALIATVTFAAGFTLPGGYRGDDGIAVLSKKAAFKAFVVADSIAVMLSLSAVFVYFLMVIYDKDDLLTKHLVHGFSLTLGAIVAMLVAFMTGLYAVLPFSSGLPIATCIICCCFLFSFYFGFRQCYKSLKYTV